jgi:predicted dehydrogenase
MTGEVSIFEKSNNDWSSLMTSQNDLENTYDLEWKNFMDSIESVDSVMVSGEDGLRALEIIDCARISASLGKKIKVLKSGN